MTELLDIAKGASLKAGEFLAGQGRSMVSVDSETRWDIKIAADKGSERVIIDYLKDKADFSILSEETGMIAIENSEFTWVVDPLDGTFNYVRRLPFCCVSVGLWQGPRPILGVVYDFNRGELFSGIVDQGAWLNDVPIASSLAGKKAKAALCTGFPVNSDFSTDNLVAFTKRVQSYQKIRMLGSAALSLCYVACGRVDVYLEDNIMFWDIAAGVAIAKAAGCLYDIKQGSKDNAFDLKLFSPSLTNE